MEARTSSRALLWADGGLFGHGLFDKGRQRGGNIADPGRYVCCLVDFECRCDVLPGLDKVPVSVGLFVCFEGTQILGAGRGDDFCVRISARDLRGCEKYVWRLRSDWECRATYGWRAVSARMSRTRARVSASSGAVSTEDSSGRRFGAAGARGCKVGSVRRTAAVASNGTTVHRLKGR
jgi:hypothetical protein